jgi:hypothetical protein
LTDSICRRRAYQLRQRRKLFDFRWLEKRILPLGFRLVLVTRSPVSYLWSVGGLSGASLASVAIIIPPGWGVGLHNGSPIPLQLVLDGADTNSAPEIQGAVQQIVGEYQSRSLETMIDDLPEEVFDLGRKLPEFVRKNFSSSMSPWAVKSRLLFLPCVSRNKHLFRRHR